jgi:hypothetical protein
MGVTNLRNEKRVRRVLKRARSNGWNIRRGDPDWVAYDPMSLYLFDIQTGYLASAYINIDDFRKIAETRDQLGDHVIIETLVSLIADLADTKVPIHLEQNILNTAFYFMCRYAKLTQTYRVMPELKNGHFFVVLYRHPGIKDLHLRPFAQYTPHVEGLLDADKVKEYILDIITVDRKNHPDWMLPTAELIPFQKL